MQNDEGVLMYLRGVADLLEATAQGKIHVGHSEKLLSYAQAARNLVEVEEAAKADLAIRTKGV